MSQDFEFEAWFDHEYPREPGGGRPKYQNRSTTNLMRESYEAGRSLERRRIASGDAGPTNRQFTLSERAFLAELEWCITDGHCGQRTRDALKHARAILGAAPVADSAEKSLAPEGSEAGHANSARERKLPAPSRVGDQTRIANNYDSAMAKDAERYRWLRAQRWNESTLFVVACHYSAVRLGTDCPSIERLDEAIDAAIAASAKSTNDA